MEDSIIERIKKIIAIKKMSSRAFAKAIDFNYTTLNNYLTGRRINVDNALIIKIISTFDDVSAKWLLTGEDETIKFVVHSTDNVVTGRDAIGNNSNITGGIGHTVKNGNINGDGNIVGIVPADVERQLVRAKAEIDVLKKRIKEIETYHKKEKEVLIKMLDQAVLDKERAMSMLEKALNK